MFVYPMVFPLRIKYIVLVFRCYHRVMEEDKITEARARNHKTLRKCLWMETIKKREREEHIINSHRIVDTHHTLISMIFPVAAAAAAYTHEPWPCATKIKSKVITFIQLFRYTLC